MATTRRGFLAGLGAGAALAAAPGYALSAAHAARPGKVALQLYSIHKYIEKVGLPKALADVKAIGYEGVEFAGYFNHKPEELRKMLADNGLAVCGTHVYWNGEFAPSNYKKLCEFNLAYGNTHLYCPGGGNVPPGCDGDKEVAPCKEIDDFTKKLCDFYNKAAEDCGAMGCHVGIHNHTFEHRVKMTDGSSFWDYFFSHTDKAVQMEQDVGWTVHAGVDPCAQYVKYPHRSYTLHAKENGWGPGVVSFDGVLGQPGKPNQKGVDWDSLFKVTDADGVQWYVVECEVHADSLLAVRESYDFLKAKGRAPSPC